MENHKDKPGAGRNPFPDEPFFIVPIKLLESGLASQLKGSEFKRYITFLRLANYYKKTSFQATLEALEKLDGIAARTAHDTHVYLQERGMILVERNTNPYTYVVLLPSEWRDRCAHPFPPSKIPRSYVLST